MILISPKQDISLQSLQPIREKSILFVSFVWVSFMLCDHTTLLIFLFGFIRDNFLQDLFPISWRCELISWLSSFILVLWSLMDTKDADIFSSSWLPPCLGVPLCCLPWVEGIYWLVFRKDHSCIRWNRVRIRFSWCSLVWWFIW